MPLLGAVTNPYVRASPLLMSLLDRVNTKHLHEDSVEHVLALFEQHKQHKHGNNNSSSSRKSKGSSTPKCCRTSGAIRSVLCQPLNIVMPVVVPPPATTTTNKASRAIKIGFDLQAGSYATCCLRSMTGRNDLLL